MEPRLRFGPEFGSERFGENRHLSGHEVAAIPYRREASGPCGSEPVAYSGTRSARESGCSGA
jgi:hypothetical protein